MSFMYWRFERIADSYFNDSLVLDKASVKEKLALARDLFDSNPVKEASLDGADKDVATIQEWLRTIPLSGDVYVLWLSDNEGIRCDYDKFARWYDDLWYPSSDDVWIVNPDATGLLELDHEEIFCWFQAPDRIGDSQY